AKQHERRIARHQVHLHAPVIRPAERALIRTEHQSAAHVLQNRHVDGRRRDGDGHPPGRQGQEVGDRCGHDGRTRSERIEFDSTGDAGVWNCVAAIVAVWSWAPFSPPFWSSSAIPALLFVAVTTSGGAPKRRGSSDCIVFWTVGTPTRTTKSILEESAVVAGGRLTISNTGRTSF